MQKHMQTIMMIVVALAGMAAIGYSYERCIGPSHPVWLKDARHWGELPLVVSWDHEEWGDHSDSFALAIKRVNKELDCTVLETSGFINVNILSANGEPCSQSSIFSDDDNGAESWLCPDGTAEIHISLPGTTNCSARIAMHELGHVLGLGHTPAGIMRYGGGCDDLMIFSDVQRAALKERYCRP